MINGKGEVKTDSTSIVEHFVNYYQNLLGKPVTRRTHVESATISMGPMLSLHQQIGLIREFSTEDIKRAVFSIHSLKSPGHDGFNSEFFKRSWDVIGKDVCADVSEYFVSGHMKPELNKTTLVLLAKTDAPKDATEYRPIACCTVLYKIISKLLCDRPK